MALIISPKTTEKQIAQLEKCFEIKKIPKDEANLELSNFKDNFYFSKIEKVPIYIILTGYGGASVGFAVAQYEKNYKRIDPYPEAYFLGSILKPLRSKKLKLSDILYAKNAYGKDEWTQAIYRIAKKKNISGITSPNKLLVERLLKLSRDNKITLKSGKIYCRWYPGYLKGQKTIIDMLDEGFWWKFALSEGEYKNHSYDGGEIESACFTATCNLAKIPNISLFDVRDERVSKGYEESSYRMAQGEKKEAAQMWILKLIRFSLESLNKT